MEKIRLDNTRVPLHYQIAEYLEDMVRRGELRIDDRIPPEENLAKAFGVSRTTVRRALEHLDAKSLITRKQGKGTYWTDDVRALTREKLAGLNKQIFSVSEKTAVKFISKGVEYGSREVCRYLDVDESAEFIVFRRVRWAGEEPMSYTINYLPAHFGRAITKDHLRRMTMLETLESVLGIRLGTIEHEVEITRATDDIAEKLAINVRDPVLTIKTSVSDKSGRPVEIVWTYFAENKYKFRVVLD